MLQTAKVIEIKSVVTNVFYCNDDGCMVTSLDKEAPCPTCNNALTITGFYHTVQSEYQELDDSEYGEL